ALPIFIIDQKGRFFGQKMLGSISRLKIEGDASVASIQFRQTTSESLSHLKIASILFRQTASESLSHLKFVR
ncbi:MAG: hypothetical protein PHW27_12635, partial [Melioribacteraceae bacterium]|nr:hypothetical protein [Melioribacteraceae bacterium]